MAQFGQLLDQHFSTFFSFTSLTTTRIRLYLTEHIAHYQDTNQVHGFLFLIHLVSSVFPYTTTLDDILKQLVKYVSYLAYGPLDAAEHQSQLKTEQACRVPQGRL